MSLDGVALLALSLLRDPEATSDRRIEFYYRFTVSEVPADAKQVYAWIPLPPTNRLQQVESCRVEGGLPAALLIEPEYGNQLLRLDLSKTPRPEIPVGVTFRVTRKPFRSNGSSEGEKASPQVLDRFLSSDQLVPIDGKIAEEARKVAGKVQGSEKQARTLFDHIVGSVRYDKAGTGWGRGDALYACDVRKGNCTDFHSLFIGEARALGIPARFVMGFPLPENAKEGPITGYHCWAEFYVEGRGWLPVDASEASKFPDRRDAYFAMLDAHRVEFTMGRDLKLPVSMAGPVNFFIYPHVEVDGKPHERIERDFAFKENEK